LDGAKKRTIWDKRQREGNTAEGRTEWDNGAKTKEEEYCQGAKRERKGSGIRRCVRDQSGALHGGNIKKKHIGHMRRNQAEYRLWTVSNGKSKGAANRGTGEKEKRKKEIIKNVRATRILKEKVKKKRINKRARSQKATKQGSGGTSAGSFRNKMPGGTWKESLGK